jgi:hypothetical protein
MSGNNVDDFDFTPRKILYKAMIICASKTNMSGDIYVKLIAEILLKVALSTIKQTNISPRNKCKCRVFVQCTLVQC